jgi:hypothetical protein
MSTRCQVKIISKDYERGTAITLYHHCDGYPSNMVPLIASAYRPEWKHGRVGHAAAFLIAKEPDQFEPEEGHALHGDIEYYYVVTISSQGHVADVPTWNLTVYRCSLDMKVDNFAILFDGAIDEAVKQANSMEE